MSRDAVVLIFDKSECLVVACGGKVRIGRDPKPLPHHAPARADGLAVRDVALRRNRRTPAMNRMIEGSPLCSADALACGLFKCRQTCVELLKLHQDIAECDTRAVLTLLDGCLACGEIGQIPQRLINTVKLAQIFDDSARCVRQPGCLCERSADGTHQVVLDVGNPIALLRAHLARLERQNSERYIVQGKHIEHTKLLSIIHAELSQMQLVIGLDAAALACNRER